MKITNNLLIVLIWIFCFYSVSAQTWQIVGYVEDPGLSPSISVCNDQTAWIGGGTSTTSKVFKTINGGVNWSLVPTPGINRQINTIWGMSNDIAIIGEGVVTGNAKLYRTSTSGEGWNVLLQTDGNGGHFTGLTFTKGAGNIYGYAMATRIYRSTNNGANWFEVNAGANGVSNAKNSLFITDNDFYGFGLNNGESRVRLTTNNGTAWNTHQLGIPGNYTSGIAFHNNKLYGLASTSSSMPLVARTTDGGSTWFNVNIGPGLSGTTYLFWIPWTSVVYILGENGKVKRSLDNGASWANMEMDSVTDVTHFDFTNYMGVVYGYAVSRSGAVLRVVDSILVITGQANLKNNVPENFELKQNYPNPFNPITVIEFNVPYKTDVNIIVYDVMGRKVQTIAENIYEAGSHSISFNAEGLTSGVYFYKIVTKDFTKTKRMMLVK